MIRVPSLPTAPYLPALVFLVVAAMLLSPAYAAATQISTQLSFFSGFFGGSEPAIIDQPTSSGPTTVTQSKTFDGTSTDTSFGRSGTGRTTGSGVGTGTFNSSGLKLG